MTATGTSPSFSIVPGSSPSSWSRRLAQASPAVPPPTMATPTSISSSGSSRPRLTISPGESIGGGNSRGTTAPLRDTARCSFPPPRAYGGAGERAGQGSRTQPLLEAKASPMTQIQRSYPASSVGAGGREGTSLRPLLRLQGLGELGQDLVEVAHDPQVGELEDRRVGVLVDRDDVLGALHPHLVL